MNRRFLHWFFLGVQFVMLGVSIPKVAGLFAAYDKAAMGPLIGGVDLRSWLVGIAIDLTAAVTSWAALAKFDESRKRSSLVAPAIIILVCSSLSIIANYESAALQHPAQYAGVILFSEPAPLVNPVLISAPPILVLLLILLVPSVLARERIKTAAEIEAETNQEVALIEANARLRETRARTNAAVRSAQLGGLADTFGAVAKRAGLANGAQPGVGKGALLDGPNSSAGPTGESALVALPNANISRAMWSAMPLKDRVFKSGVISTSEVAEVLSVSAAHARKLATDVRASYDDQAAVPGRKGVPYQALIDALYARRSKESFAQAEKLEKALGLSKRGPRNNLHVVSSSNDESTDEQEEAAE